MPTDVKQNSILAAATLLKVFHSQLPTSDRKALLVIFKDRLINEATRDHSLLGLQEIAKNANNQGRPGPIIPLEDLQNFTQPFFDLLKKTVRTLHLRTLETMESFTDRYSNQFNSQVQAIYNELAPLIDESDLMKATLAIKVCTNLMTKVSPTGCKNVVKSVSKFASSEMIQSGTETHHVLGYFFQVACDKNAIDNEVVTILLDAINTKQRSGALCLA